MEKKVFHYFYYQEDQNKHEPLIRKVKDNFLSQLPQNQSQQLDKCGGEDWKQN